MTDSILLSFDNQIATLTLNRPEVHNAFNAQMIAALSDVFDDITKRNDIRAVILRGEGKSFSAGADLNWMKDSINFSKEENRKDAIALAEMLNKLNTLPQLTIACVNGAAMGGGFGLVSCCDFVIADPKAKFALSEVKLGLIPATIGPYVIQAIGQRQARRFFQTGERFSADKALEIGLAHEVGDIESILANLLDEIGKNGPTAMRAAKKLCFDLAGSYVSHAMMEDTAERIATIRTTEEAQERLKRFFDR
ncbi:MAG: enoyl-CoA hydratase-related protein [Alphaproteobacteria bacterium]